MTLTFREIFSALRQLKLNRDRPLIAHASLSAFGNIQGGAETLLGAALGITNSLVMPTFTYQTMVVPQAGPPDNGITYGDPRHHNQKAVFYDPEMPADIAMGVVAETLRQHPQARRSRHPILSFAGINAEAALDAQTLAEPLAPIRVLADQDGWVLLLGVNQTVNTSMHYGEQMAGRKQFIRWALTAQGVIECPGWPGCSAGFDAIQPMITPVLRMQQVGQTLVQAMPLVELLAAVHAAIAADPVALLCAEPTCERCNAVRASI